MRLGCERETHTAESIHSPWRRRKRGLEWSPSLAQQVTIDVRSPAQSSPTRLATPPLNSQADREPYGRVDVFKRQLRGCQELHRLQVCRVALRKTHRRTHAIQERLKSLLQLRCTLLSQVFRGHARLARGEQDGLRHSNQRVILLQRDTTGDVNQLCDCRRRLSAVTVKETAQRRRWSIHKTHDERPRRDLPLRRCPRRRSS